ncbi:MAG: hypothetical protein ABI068_04740, partial [Ktedonobacterales bacterium]
VYYYFPVGSVNGNCAVNNTCPLDVGYVSSTNGGSSWSAVTQLAGPMTLTWLASTNQGYMVGDYFSASFVGGKVYPVFMVASAPSGGAYNEAAFTVSGGLVASGGNRTSAGDRVRVFPHGAPLPVTPQHTRHTAY